MDDLIDTANGWLSLLLSAMILALGCDIIRINPFHAVGSTLQNATNQITKDR